MSRSFETEVRGDDAKLLVNVGFPCNTLGPDAGKIAGAQVYGHGGMARVASVVKAADGGFRLRMLRVEQRQVADGVTREANPVEFVRADLAAAQVAPAFERMRTALAARLQAEHHPPPGQLELGPSSVSDSSVLLSLQLEDSAGAVAERGYTGYVGSADAVERVPVEYAWRALEALQPQPESVSHSAEPEDRLLLQAVWALGPQRQFYGEDGLLALAIAAGTPALIQPILQDLDADAASTRRLAVAALASITGWDARFDAAGKGRPLPDVIADYKRECSLP